MSSSPPTNTPATQQQRYQQEEEDEYDAARLDDEINALERDTLMGGEARQWQDGRIPNDGGAYNVSDS